MAIDPYIARGVTPIDPSNTLMQIARMRQVDNENSRRDQYQNMLLERQQKTEQAAVQEGELKQSLARSQWLLSQPSVVEALRANPQGAQAVYQGFGLPPDAPEEVVRGRVQQHMMETASKLGIGPPEQKPAEAPRLYQTDQGFLPADQAIGKMPYQAPQHAPLPRPSAGGAAHAATGSAAHAQGKPRPVETATKLSAMDEALQSIPLIRASLEMAAPNQRKQLLIEAAMNVPGTKGRELRQSMTFAIEGGLRAMTGAAAPESEVKRYMLMFMPSVLDSEDAQLEKLARFERWISNARGIANGAPSAPAPTQAGELDIGTIEDGYRYKGGDPSLESSWEPAR